MIQSQWVSGFSFFVSLQSCNWTNRSGRIKLGFVRRPLAVWLCRHHNPALWPLWHHMTGSRASFVNREGQDYSVDFQTSGEWVSRSERLRTIMCVCSERRCFLCVCVVKPIDIVRVSEFVSERLLQYVHVFICFGKLCIVMFSSEFIFETPEMSYCLSLFF